jgi:hypothetical protein
VEAAHRFLEAIVDRLNMPRRIAEPVRRVVAILPRLESGRAGRFARTSLYPIAMEIASLYATAEGGEVPDSEPPAASAAAANGDERAAPSAEAPAKRKRRRRRPRRETP